MTRMRDNTKYDVKQSHSVGLDSFVLSDETVAYTSLRSSKNSCLTCDERCFMTRNLTVSLSSSPTVLIGRRVEWRRFINSVGRWNCSLNGLKKSEDKELGGLV